jgi:hypothetical protein
VGGNEQCALGWEVSVRSGARDRRRFGGPLNGGRETLGDKVAGCGDDGVTGAALLGYATIELIWD